MRLDLTIAARRAYPAITLAGIPDGLVPGTFERAVLKRIHDVLATAAGPDTIVQWRVETDGCIVVFRPDGQVLDIDRERALHAAAARLGCFGSTTFGSCAVPLPLRATGP